MTVLTWVYSTIVFASGLLDVVVSPVSVKTRPQKSFFFDNWMIIHSSTLLLAHCSCNQLLVGNLAYWTRSISSQSKQTFLVVTQLTVPTISNPCTMFTYMLLTHLRIQRSVLCFALYTTTNIIPEQVTVQVFVLNCYVRNGAWQGILIGKFRDIFLIFQVPTYKKKIS